MTDLINRIDDLVKPTCGACGAPLIRTGPSDLFCNEACQERWHGHRPDLRGLQVSAAILDEAFPCPQESARSATIGLQREDGTWEHCPVTDVHFEIDWSAHRRDILAAFDVTEADIGIVRVEDDMAMAVRRARVAKQARALELRRNRNTGPTAGQSRAPRRIDPTRTRR